MKKIYSSLLFSVAAFAGNATVHTITAGAGGFLFTPSAVNAQCGDTIQWAWSSGSHTTTSTTIPNCASAWDSPLNSTSTSYSITVTCAGTFNYKCTPHGGMGMTGSIVVTCPAGVSAIPLPTVSSSYPNPFVSKIMIEFPEGGDGVCLYNAVGEKVRNISLLPGQVTIEMNLAGLPQGIYFYCITKEGVVTETKKIVKD